jgi:ankyrin repeat protein
MASDVFGFVEKGNVEELRKWQGDINMKDEDACSLLEYAFREDQLECAKHLLERGATLNEEEWCPYYWAAVNGNAKCLQYLADRGITCDNKPHTFQTAVTGGNLECVKFMVERQFIAANMRFDNKRLREPLYLAASQGHLHCIQYLVEQGADVNEQDAADGRAPIHTAAANGNFDCLVYLVKHGANVNAALNKSADSHNTSLLLASLNGHLTCVEYLVQQGAPVNGLPDGKSPLEAAATKHGNTHVISWLLSNGADPFRCKGKIFTDGRDMIRKARRTFKERLVIQTMMSVKTHHKFGQQSTLKVLPIDIIRRLHSYFV